MKAAKAILRAPETITLLLLVVSIIIGSVMSPYFLDVEYLLDKTSEIIPVGFLALAMTFIIISGNIDLSVASGSVLTAVTCAIAFENGLPMPLVIVLALLLGSALGLFNGLLVTRLKLPSLVVTLGTLALYRGLAQVLIGERAIRGFPSWFAGVDYVKLSIIPLPLILLIAMAILAHVLLTWTTFGRRVYAIGTNESASFYSGINTNRTKLLIFALSGLCMGIAALLLMSMRPVDYKQLRGGELLAITAVVLGGTSIVGGRGRILGTVLAILLLVCVTSAMGVANVRVENRLAVIGALLVGAVLLTDLTGWLFAHSRKKPEGSGA
ncbi:MAG: ABC transporter permease [Chthoniobacterales bacterium]|nr:ABC transporter permease [Chthoniobacterales bacterium]